MKLTRRVLAFVLILALLLTNSGVTALADAVLTMPVALQIIEEEAFYGSTSIDKVALSNNVTEIRARAFANSTLSEINLPESLTFIDPSAFDGPEKVKVTVQVGTYAYNWAVNEGYVIPVSSIILNKEKLVLKPNTSEQLTFSVNPVNATNSDVSWSVDEPEIATVSDEGIVTAISEGTATVIATANDGSGIMGSCALTVVNETINTRLDTNKESFLQNDRVIVSAETDHAIGTVSYTYQIKDKDGTVIETTDTASSADYEFVAYTTGDFVIACTAIDQAGGTATDSIGISVYSFDQVRPTTPSEIYLNGVALSSTSDNAVKYSQKEFSFSWNAPTSNEINKADHYKVDVRIKTAAGYSLIAHYDNLRLLSFELPDNIFSNITEDALIQVQLTAKNIVSGNTTIGYFKVKSLEEQQKITINGKTALNYNVVSYSQQKESFIIKSDEDWTAECDAEWIVCHRSGNCLELFLDQNPVAYTRSTDVYVNNGFNTATIHVTQGCVRKAPEITYPSIVSGAQGIPFGNLYLEFEKNRSDVIVARLLKKDNSGDYTFVSHQKTTGSSMTMPLPEALVGSDCLLEISGYTNEAYAEWSADTVGTFVKNYYFTCTNNHFVSVDGQEQLSLTITTSKSIIIHASTMWSFTSDAEWLDLDVTSASVNKPDCSCTITTTPNLTEETRVGHISITSGDSNATITIRQPSLIPYATTAKGLSTDIFHPTKLRHWETQFFCYSFSSLKMIEIERKYFGENTTFTEVGILYEKAFDEIQESLFLTLHDIDVSTNARCIKLIVSNPYDSIEYYFDAYEDSYNQHMEMDIGLTDNQYTDVQNLQWNVFAEATQKTVHLKMSRSLSQRGWTITTDADWITLSQTANSYTNQREADIVVDIDQNNTGIARTATVTFKPKTSTSIALLIIEQSAMDYISVISNDTMIPYDDGELLSVSSGSEIIFGLRIQTGGAWSVHSNDEWISVCTNGTIQYQSEATYEGINLLLSNNPYGNEPRTGTVCFTSGGSTFTLFIEQIAQLQPLSKPVIISEIDSTSHDNPSIYVQHNLDISWVQIESAVGYRVSLSNGNDEYEYYVESSGEAEYSYSIPITWIPVSEQIVSLTLSAFDAQGKAYPSDTYYFVTTMSDKAIIEGGFDPKWHDIDDRGETKEFTIMASDAWTATVEESWIHISQNSGTNNETITVTVEPNESVGRQGYVYFTVNGNTTVLSIRQLAALSLYPQVIISEYSENPAIPTIITTDTDEINVLWDYEKQADAYCLYLQTYNEEGAWTSVAESGLITNGIGNYTFDDTSLEPYVIYCISLNRIVYGHDNLEANRYFVIEEEPPSIQIKIDGGGDYHPTEWIDKWGRERPADELHMWGDGDSIPLRVIASGTMTVTANDDWVMVARNNLTPKKLAKYHKTANDYKFMLMPAPVYIQNYGYVSRDFRISALPNYTGHSRQGSVTLSCGTYSITIPFTQSAEILPAKLYSPQLSQDSKNVTLLPYEKISLRWYEGQFGTGEYNTVLYEKKQYDSDYQVVKTSRISENLYCYINTQYLHKGSDYKLRLYTYGNDGDEVYESYYFHILDDDEIVEDPFLELSSNNWTIMDCNSTLVLKINTADAWTVSNCPSWITINNSSGVGKSTIVLRATENEQNTDRSGELVISTAYYSQTLKIVEKYNDSDFYFMMSGDEINVGEDVGFIVYAKDADLIRLYVDGAAYESYQLENHTLSFRRRFTSGGERTIAFQQYSNGTWNSICPSQILKVKSAGDLDQPIISQPEPIYIGESVQINWQTVENASEYTVRVYYVANNASIVLSTDATKDNSIVLSGDLFQTIGRYDILVMATGNGYSQSQSKVSLEVKSHEYTVNINTPVNGNEFVYGDTLYITASQTGGGYMIIVIKDDDGNEHCYPADGEDLYTDETILITQTVENVSAYSITAYVFPTNNRLPYSQAAKASNTVSVTVNGPIIYYAYSEAKNYTWVTPASSKHMVVHTNNNVGHISIMDNNRTLVDDYTDYKENESFYRDFTISLDTGLTKGRHEIVITAYNQDKTESTIYSYCVYVVETVTNGDTVYPKNETATLYSSPYKGSVKGTASGGEYYDCLKIIGDTDDWYRVSVSNLNGFIQKSEVSPSIPANAANGIKIISPANKSQFSSSESVTFKWKAASSRPGTELLNASISFRKADTPDISYKPYSVPSGTTEWTVPMSDFEEGTYVYSIGVLTSYNNGITTVYDMLLSDDYQLTIGSITLEESYRNWWMNNVAGIITQYNNGITQLDNSHLSGRYKNQITVSGYAPTGLYSSYLLSAYELSQDQLRMNWSWTQDDNNYQKIRSVMPDELERLTRIAIISAMQQDEESNRLSAPLSAMRNVSLNEDNLLANAKRMVMQRETTVDVATEAIEEIYQAVIIAMKAGELCSGEIGDADAENVMQEILEIFWNVLKAYLQDSVSEADAKVVLKAYVNQYKIALQQAADIYIDYLEEAYFGANAANFDNVQKQVARSVINDFKAFKNDNSRLEQIAIDAFINSQSKYQWSDIENESDEFWAFLREGMTPQACYDLMIDTLKGVLKDWLKDYLGANPTTAKYVDKVADMIDALIKVDISSTGKLNTSLDVDAFLEKLAETAGRDIGRDFLTVIFQNKISNGAWKIAIEAKMHNELNLNWVHHDINEVYKKETGAFTKMCKACWKFGKGLPKLVFDIEQLIEACQGRGEYDTYSNLMQSGIQNSLSIWINSGLSPFKQQSQFTHLTIKELEHLRQSMIALVKSDEYIIKMYERMKKIDQNAGCSFTKAYTSFSWVSTDNAFASFEIYKKKMMSIPSTYQEIVNSVETAY